MRNESFFGRNYLADSDGLSLSDRRIERAHMGAGADRDVVRLAVYDTVDCACASSVYSQLTGRETNRWGSDTQDATFGIADDILADWLAIPKGDRMTLADVLEAHILEINAANPSAISKEELEKWNRLLAQP